LLVFVLFTMPFFTVSCSGQKVATFTGYQIVSGNTTIDTSSISSALGGSGQSAPTAPQGNSIGQLILVVALLVAAIGVVLPLLPLRMKDPLLVLTILGALGVVVLIIFAVMAPGQITAEAKQLGVTGDVEMGVWLSLLAMAGAGGYAFLLRSQGVDASTPLSFQRLFASTPGAGPQMAAPHAAVPSAPSVSPAPADGGAACPQCSKPAGPGDTFCPSCGAALGSDPGKSASS
jgi:hypothetical protein